MEKQATSGSQRKASLLHLRSIIIAFLIGSAVIGSWIVVSQMLHTPPSPVKQSAAAIPVKQDIDLSTLSNDILYVRSSVHEGDPYSSGSTTSFTHYSIYAIHLTNGATTWKYDIGSLLDVQVPLTELLLAS